MPDRAHQINAALLNLRRHPRMRCVEMVNDTVPIPRENRNRRVLVPLTIFTAQIVFECAISCAQKTQSVPSSISPVRPESRQLSGGYDREIDVLRHMRRDSIHPVNPRGAHWARFG